MTQPFRCTHVLLTFSILVDNRKIVSSSTDFCLNTKWVKANVVCVNGFENGSSTVYWN